MRGAKGEVRGTDAEARAAAVRPWPVDAVTVLNSLCGYGSFAFFCLTLPLFLPFAFILPGGRRHWIAAAMRFAMRRVFNVTPTVTWRFDGDLAALRDARVVVSNHEGMLDILAACGLPGTRTLLAKTWVFRAFPLGVAARAAGLYNSDALTPEDFQEGATLTLPDPRTGIFVFPEGSRSRDGAVHRFRPGAFVLARHLDVPVVPVVMAGSRQGIRPGSMWIHPTRILTRVLPPMRPLVEENHRQFAARVREAIVRGRHQVMCDLLAQGHLERHRRHRATGLPYPLRSAVLAEAATRAWEVVLDLPYRTGDWLFLGCGWSSLPFTSRLLDPQGRIFVIEADAQRQEAARHLWVEVGDHLVNTLDDLPALAPFTTIVCTWPTDHPERAVALKRLVSEQVGHLVLVGDAAVPRGFAANGGRHGWQVFTRPARD